MKLSEIAGAIAQAGFGQSTSVPAGLRQVADSQREALAKYTVKEIVSKPPE